MANEAVQVLHAVKVWNVSHQYMSAIFSKIRGETKAGTHHYLVIWFCHKSTICGQHDVH